MYGLFFWLCYPSTPQGTLQPSRRSRAHFFLQVLRSWVPAGASGSKVSSSVLPCEIAKSCTGSMHVVAHASQQGIPNRETYTTHNKSVTISGYLRHSVRGRRVLRLSAWDTLQAQEPVALEQLGKLKRCGALAYRYVQVLTTMCRYMRRSSKFSNKEMFATLTSKLSSAIDFGNDLNLDSLHLQVEPQVKLIWGL